MKKRIEDLLHGNGNIIAESRRRGQSLSMPDRRIILRVRQQAAAEGFAPHTINAFEMEGERGLRGSRPFPINARYIGTMEGGPFGFGLRLYNIEGDHTLNNSTVGVSTLVRNGIFPRDLSLLRIAAEYLKEQITTAWWYVSCTWSRIKIALGGRS